jgi:hypothetical protein
MYKKNDLKHSTINGQFNYNGCFDTIKTAIP